MSEVTSKSNPIPEDAPQEEEEPKKPSQQIMRHELKEALAAFDRKSGRLFFSGLSAGLENGFSLFLMAVMQTLVQDELPKPVVTLLIANM
jgi:hypothetical protein